jgi:signal transduction histidine kinase
MRLRQKLFAAVFAAMVIVFLLLALVSFMQVLEGQRARHVLKSQFTDAAIRAFRKATVSAAEDRWDQLSADLGSLGFGTEWAVLEEGAVVAGRKDTESLAHMAQEGDHGLLVGTGLPGFEPIRWLSGLIWAVATGTAVLLLVVYGLLLRLVLRPVEDLAEASRALSKGARPAAVKGEGRTDEMGDLIRTFNTMAAEVASSREELQRRVEEATREYEKAQRRLVLEQRLAATGKLAAGIAHEINNPLGGMMNAARTLAEKEDALSERGREYLGLIRDGLGRIGKIVERMREFVRPHLSVGAVDLAEAVRGALAFVRHRVDAEGVKVDERIPSEPITVTGDAGELQQVLLNLIVNALDAMRASEKRELALGLASVGEGAGGEAVVTVADTGAGMDAEQLANAFDLFYSTKGEGGTGLGLAIAHKIVTDHGGTIELESSVESGKSGTTARVRLPLVGQGEDDGRGNDT